MKKHIILGFAFFIATLNLRPAINSISPLLDMIRGELGMSAAMASLLTSIPILCMGLFSPLAVKVSGRLGIERVIGYSLFVIGMGTGLRLFASSTLVLLGTSWVVGIGIASIGPLASGFIKRYFPQQVTLMIAVYSISITIGAAVSSMVSSPFQAYLGSWQRAIAVWAVLAIVAGVGWFILLRKNVQPVVNTSSGKIKLPWTSGRVWIITLSFGLMAMLFYSFTAWLPLMIQEMGHTKSYATLCLTLFVVIQIPVSLLLPLLLRSFPSKRGWMVTESLLIVMGLVLLLSGISPLVATLVIGTGAGGLFTLNLMLPIDGTTQVQEATSWSAMQQSVGYVIGATGPLLLGWLHDGTQSFVPAISGLLVITVIMIFIQIAATRRL